MGDQTDQITGYTVQSEMPIRTTPFPLGVNLTIGKGSDTIQLGLTPEAAAALAKNLMKAVNQSTGLV